jgi:glycine/D-amino acid oxidase-like deaminating enzyme
MKPFHYIRAFGNRELWVGGEDVVLTESATFDEKEKIAALRGYVENEIKISQSGQYLGYWSGTFFESKRSVPYVYQDKKTGIMYSVGFGGSGLLISLASGYLQYMWQKGKMGEYKKLFDKDWK